MNTPVWEPFAAQRPFLASTAYEALYGGAAGGGKTDALVLGALASIAHPHYHGVIFRRTYPELEGKVVPVSREWYPHAGGDFSDFTWTFKSGARVTFAHLQHEDDVYKYQGHEFQYVGFDELTHFTERQYTYLLTRVRTVDGIPLRVRAGTNPGGPGHEWVFKRWSPWLDPQSAVRAAPGKSLRYRNTPEGSEWCDTGKFSRVFFPARASDNPHLSIDYVDSLMGQDRVTRAQLIDGDWLIRPASGAYFRRDWFKLVEVAPTDVLSRVRRWDLASTQDGGDWTVGARLCRLRGGGWCIDDMVRVRLRPEGVKRTVLNTARLDGPTTRIVIPQDPGQAGKAQCEDYARDLAGYDVRFERETGDKVTRAQPFSAQCEARNVSMLVAPWNEPVIQALEAFPEPGVHDDDVDALAGAFHALHGASLSEFLHAWGTL